MSAEPVEGFPKITRVKPLLAKRICTACSTWLTKEAFVVEKRVLCLACAKEVAYGVVPRGLPLQSFGGRGRPDADDDNPWGSNARRAAEGDR